MTALLVVAAVGVAVELAAGLILYRHVRAQGRPQPEPAAWLDRQTRRTLTVHLTDDLTVEGLLEHVDEDGVVLLAARLIRPDGPLELGGRTYVPREKVRFVQRHDRARRPRQR